MKWKLCMKHTHSGIKLSSYLAEKQSFILTPQYLKNLKDSSKIPDSWFIFDICNVRIRIVNARVYCRTNSRLKHWQRFNHANYIFWREQINAIYTVTTDNLLNIISIRFCKNTSASIKRICCSDIRLNYATRRRRL